LPVVQNSPAPQAGPPLHATGGSSVSEADSPCVDVDVGSVCDVSSVGSPHAADDDNPNIAIPSTLEPNVPRMIRSTS
jgi:hypothetical protein